MSLLHGAVSCSFLLSCWGTQIQHSSTGGYGKTHHSKDIEDRIEGIAYFEVVHASLELVREVEERSKKQSVWGPLYVALGDLPKGAGLNPKDASLDCDRSDPEKEVA